MKTKNLLIVLGLCFSSLCANADAQPAASKIDWTSPTAQQYSLAFDVIDVKVLTSGKSGYSVTVSTVISEGH